MIAKSMITTLWLVRCLAWNHRLIMSDHFWWFLSTPLRLALGAGRKTFLEKHDLGVEGVGLGGCRVLPGVGAVLAGVLALAGRLATLLRHRACSASAGLTSLSVRLPRPETQTTVEKPDRPAGHGRPHPELSRPSPRKRRQDHQLISRWIRAQAASGFTKRAWSHRSTRF